MAAAMHAAGVFRALCYIARGAFVRVSGPVGLQFAGRLLIDFDVTETPAAGFRTRLAERLAPAADFLRALWNAASPRQRQVAGASMAAVLLAISAGGVSSALAGLQETVSYRRAPVNDLSLTGFAAHIAGMDGVMISLAARFDRPGRFGGPPPTAANDAVTADSSLRRTVDSGGDESPVFRWQALSPEQARMINASLPVSVTSNPPARPFRLKSDSAVENLRALDCLTAAVYYEAAKENDAGQQAVAQVVLNRMRHIAYPKTVCGVVFQGSQRTTGCQFSFTCDGSLDRPPVPALWTRASKAASAALNGSVMKAVGNATHYHAVYVAPYWMPSLVKVATVGAHVFYRWEGGWGRPGAFNERYAGYELDGIPNTDLGFLTPVKMEKLESGLAPKAAAPQDVAAPPAPVVFEIAEAAEPIAAIEPLVAAAAPAPVMSDPFKASTAPRVNSRLAIPSGAGWQGGR